MSATDTPNTIPFTEEQMETMIVESVKKFFDTMLSAEVIKTESFSIDESHRGKKWDPINTENPIVASAVGFIGTINGVLYLYFEEPAAMKIACGFLGMDESEVTDEGPDTVNDVLGEVSNMIVGTFKNQMCDKGYNCRLTIPSILRGQKFSIQSVSSVQRHVYRFSSMGTAFTADLLMKVGESN